MPADPNRRAKATVDIIDAILDGTLPAKDPERVARGKLGGAKGGKLRAEPDLSPTPQTETLPRLATALRRAG
jgi:hypothetical protein